MAIVSLYDVEALQQLELVAQRCGVQLTLFGSVATRIALRDRFDCLKGTDLFSLTEHASDIDIAHSGPSSLTANIRRQIDLNFPLSSRFRWSIIDRDQLAAFDEQMAFNDIIPLRRIRIGESIQTPQGALEDAENRIVRFTRNPRFLESPRARRNFDTEAAAVLLCVDAATDVLEVQKAAGLDPGLETISGEFEAAIHGAIDHLNALQLKPAQYELALRRIWYRLAAAAIRLDPAWLERQVEAFKLAPLCAYLRDSKYRFAVDRLWMDAKGPVVIASAVKGGWFRANPAPDLEILYAKAAEEALNDTLDQLTKSTRADQPATPLRSSDDGPFRLGEGHTPLAAIVGLPLIPGPAPSARGRQLIGQDFLHISSVWDDKNLSMKAAPDLAIVAIGRKNDHYALLPLAGVASLSLPYGMRVTIRVNLSVLGFLPDSIDIFIVTFEYTHERSHSP